MSSCSNTLLCIPRRTTSFRAPAAGRCSQNSFQSSSRESRYSSSSMAQAVGATPALPRVNRGTPRSASSWAMRSETDWRETYSASAARLMFPAWYTARKNCSVLASISMLGSAPLELPAR